MSMEMGSRIEQLVRTALQTFALKPNGSLANKTNIGELLQSLRKLASEITAHDISLPVPTATSSTLGRQDSKSGIAPVSYVDVFENKCISIGVFILKDGAKIPLHDHQGMYGIIKTLYGNLHIRSYTPLGTTSVNTDNGPRTALYAQKHPLAILTEKDEAVCLDPVGRNLHELWSVGGPAAFLDVLAPPYNETGDNCFYYQENNHNSDGYDKCLLTTIPCPPSFWCDSVHYKGPDLHHLYKL